MGVGAPAGKHVVDGVDRAAASLGEQVVGTADDAVDRLQGDVLEYRDRIHGVVVACQRPTRRKAIAEAGEPLQNGEPVPI